MGTRKIHLHSMMVHAVAALVPLAAVAYIFLKLNVEFFRFDDYTWRFIIVFSLIMAFLISLLSILTGVFERGHIYANWHATHKYKLILSLLLAALLIIEFVLMGTRGFSNPIFSLLGILIILGNNVITFFLCFFGLKITLGRQSIARASYIPDLFKKEPIDILVTAGENRKEEPKFVDILVER